MPSRTLEHILEHWNKPFEGEGYTDLPFNLEVFCRENDVRINEMEVLIRDVLYTRGCGNCDGCAACGGGVEDLRNMAKNYFKDRK